MTKDKRVWLADMGCLLTAVIWGTGFVVSEWAIESNVSAAFIMAGRFSIAAVIMLLINVPILKQIKKEDFLKGVVAGTFLFVSFYVQIVGQALTTVSHTAFLTATNVVMVPFLVWLFTKRKPKMKSFVLAAFALLGIAILTLSGDAAAAGVYAGDILILLCALGFGIHIAYLGSALMTGNPRVINLVQLTTAAVLSLLVLPFVGVGDVQAIDWPSGIASVLYLGFFSTCICYLLQTFAQKYTTASKASILLSAEGLFGTLFAVMIGMEHASVAMAIGGCIILASIVLLEAKLPWEKKKETAKESVKESV